MRRSLGLASACHFWTIAAVAVMWFSRDVARCTIECKRVTGWGYQPPACFQQGMTTLINRTQHPNDMYGKTQLHICYTPLSKFQTELETYPGGIQASESQCNIFLLRSLTFITSSKPYYNFHRPRGLPLEWWLPSKISVLCYLLVEIGLRAYKQCFRHWCIVTQWSTSMCADGKV